MKRLIATLVMSTSLMAHAEFYTGNDLLNKINADNAIDRMVGLGYVMGVFDTVNGIDHCPPDNVTSGQIRDMVRNHLVASPSVRHLSADLQVRYVLKNAWPCAKKNSGSNL